MSRNFDFRSETFREYAQALGEAALAWNDLHMVLSSLFGVATRIPNKLAPDTIWNSLKSDRAQREMLEALVGLSIISYNIAPKLRREIEWVLKETTKLEDLRNNLLHAPVFKDGPNKIFAWHQLGNSRAKQLKEKDILKEARWFYDTVIALREYAEKLGHILSQMPNPAEPLPDRPALPNRGRPSAR